MATQYGPPAVFGIQEPKPIQGLPPGRVRVRMRADEFARVFVRTVTGIRGFHLVERGEFWGAYAEFGSNTTADT